MTDTKGDDPSGVPPVPSGDSNNPDTPSGEPTKDPAGHTGQVDYKSYQKLLSEKKRVQAELNELKSESERRKAEELASQQKFEELWKSSEQKNAELQEKVTAHETRWQDAIKLNAFHEALGDTRKIDSKYSGFIDTSKILVDPNTGKVDQVSAQREVERVVNDYPEIVKSTVTSHLPNTSPNSNASLTPEQWKKLPLAEMKKRRKEVKF